MFHQQRQQVQEILTPRTEAHATPTVVETEVARLQRLVDNGNSVARMRVPYTPDGRLQALHSIGEARSEPVKAQRRSIVTHRRRAEDVVRRAPATRSVQSVSAVLADSAILADNSTSVQIWANLSETAGTSQPLKTHSKGTERTERTAKAPTYGEITATAQQKLDKFRDAANAANFSNISAALRPSGAAQTHAVTASQEAGGEEHDTRQVHSARVADTATGGDDVRGYMSSRAGPDKSERKMSRYLHMGQPGKIKPLVPLKPDTRKRLIMLKFQDPRVEFRLPSDVNVVNSKARQSPNGMIDLGAIC